MIIHHAENTSLGFFTDSVTSVKFWGCKYDYNGAYSNNSGSCTFGVKEIIKYIKRK